MTLRLLAGVMVAVGTTLAAQTRTTADTASSVSRLLWAGPDTLTGRGRLARDVVNALQSRLTAKDSVTLVRFGSGDTTASVDAARGSSVVTHRLYKKNGRWVVSDTFAIKVYRTATKAEELKFEKDSVATRTDVEYLQPRLPPDMVITSKDTLRVSSKPDGSCDWNRTSSRWLPPPQGRAALMGERHHKECVLVRYFVIMPAYLRSGAKADMARPSPRKP